jgi:hypothetical protein
MAKPEIEWTFAEAPEADEAPPGGRRPRRRATPAVWRWLAVGLALGVLLAGGLAAGYWLVVRQGEQGAAADVDVV